MLVVGVGRGRWFQAPIRGLGHNWASRQPVQTLHRAQSSRTHDDPALGPTRDSWAQYFPVYLQAHPSTSALLAPLQTYQHFSPGANLP